MAECQPVVVVLSGGGAIGLCHRNEDGEGRVDLVVVDGGGSVALVRLTRAEVDGLGMCFGVLRETNHDEGRGGLVPLPGVRRDWCCETDCCRAGAT